MAIPTKTIIAFLKKNAVPIAAGGAGLAVGGVTANALNGGSNTPQDTKQTQTPTFNYRQYLDASNTVNYNITSGGSTIIDTDTSTRAEPKTSYSPEQSASSKAGGGSLLFPALAVGGALVVAGVALWNR